MTRADPLARERAALWRAALERGYVVEMLPDGTVKAVPPAQAPAKGDPFELLDMRR